MIRTHAGLILRDTQLPVIIAVVEGYWGCLRAAPARLLSFTQGFKAVVKLLMKILSDCAHVFLIEVDGISICTSGRAI